MPAAWCGADGTVTGMHQNGFTLIELIIVVVLIGLVVGVAAPGWLSARILGRETAAIVAMRAINDAEASYASVCGRGTYAVRFPVLAVPPPGSSTGFLSSDLTIDEQPIKSGYQYTLGPGAGGEPGGEDCNGSPTHTAYYATAVPVNPGTSGRRAFATNQEHEVWQNTSGTPPSEPFEAVDGASLAR